MHNFSTYLPSVRITAQRLIANAEMFPAIYIRDEDGTLISQVAETFFRDLMDDSSILGLRQELCGSPPKLVITVLRASDVFKPPGK